MSTLNGVSGFQPTPHADQPQGGNVHRLAAQFEGKIPLHPTQRKVNLNVNQQQSADKTGQFAGQIGGNQEGNDSTRGPSEVAGHTKRENIQLGGIQVGSLDVQEQTEQTSSFLSRIIAYIQKKLSNLNPRAYINKANGEASVMQPRRQRSNSLPNAASPNGDTSVKQPAGRKRSNSLPNAVSPNGDASLIQENRKRSLSDFNPLTFFQKKGKVESVKAETVKETPEQLSAAAKKLSDFLLSNDSFFKNEGIFRLSGSASQVKELYNKLMTSPESVNLNEVDENVLAGAYKQVYREANLFEQKAEEFEKVGNALKEALSLDDTAGAIQLLKELKATLPASGQEDLKKFIEVLNKTSKSSEVNKMTPSNLAIVGGPNLCSSADPMLGNLIAENFIKHYEAVFEK